MLTLGDRRFWLGLFVMFVVFAANPAHLRTAWGDGDGQWADQVDSYSEYLVRNTMKNAVLGHENTGLFTIQTKGYPTDYRYFPDGTERYWTAMVMQATVGSLAVRAMGLKTEYAVDQFAEVLRMLNALCLAAALAIFFRRVAAESAWTNPLPMMVLTAASTGFGLFGQNLFFIAAVYALPLAFLSLVYGRWSLRAVLAGVFGLALLNFSRGYEFTTLYAFICLLPILAFRVHESYQTKRNAIAAVFLTTVVAFAVATVVHVSLIHLMGYSWNESRALAFSSLTKRTMSIQDVPAPWSMGFVHVMSRRLGDSAFLLPPIPKFPIVIPRLMVLLGLGTWVLVRWRQLAITDIRLVAWGFLAYGSWYVFGYQHIIFHSQYDAFLFAFSIGLTTALVLHSQIAGIHLRAVDEPRPDTRPVPSMRVADG